MSAFFELHKNLPPDGPFDVIWSAGALCFLAVETGLKTWAPLLKDRRGHKKETGYGQFLVPPQS